MTKTKNPSAMGEHQERERAYLLAVDMPNQVTYIGLSFIGANDAYDSFTTKKRNTCEVVGHMGPKSRDGSYSLEATIQLPSLTRERIMALLETIVCSTPKLLEDSKGKNYTKFLKELYNQYPEKGEMITICTESAVIHELDEIDTDF